MKIEQIELLPEKQEHDKRASPSSLEMRERCPCFWQDNSKPNEAADEGTRMHEAVEHDDPERIADRYDRELVLKSMLHKQILIGKYPNAVIYNEKRLESSINHGTGDLVLIDFGLQTGVVLDYKFGVEKVTAPERNIQLWNYAYNLLSEFAELETVQIYISQPKCGDEMEHFEIRRDMIHVIRSRIERIINKYEDPNKQPTPDDKACTYCEKRDKGVEGTTCPALKDLALSLFTEQYGLTVPTDMILGLDHDAKTVGYKYCFYSLMEALCSQGKKEAAKQAELLHQQGIKIEGATLIHRKGNLKVVSPEAMLDIINQKVSEMDILLNCCNISAKKVSELLKDQVNEDPVVFIGKMLDMGVFERGKESIYLKKGSKVNQMKMLTETT